MSRNLGRQAECSPIRAQVNAGVFEPEQESELASGQVCAALLATSLSAELGNEVETWLTRMAAGFVGTHTTPHKLMLSCLGA